MAPALAKNRHNGEDRKPPKIAREKNHYPRADITFPLYTGLKANGAMQPRLPNSCTSGRVSVPLPLGDFGFRSCEARLPKSGTLGLSKLNWNACRKCC